MKTVLVVDDEGEAREFVRGLLEAQGWQVEEAEDGEQGLRKAKQARPDLIVLDVQMPKLDGFAVFAELAKDAQTSGIKVIMLTGVREKTGVRFSSEEMGEFLGRKPAAYVEKPVEPRSLVRTVERVMAGK